MLCDFVNYRISIIIIFFERKIIIMDKAELITSIKAMTADERVKMACTTRDEEILTIFPKTNVGLFVRLLLLI